MSVLHITPQRYSEIFSRVSEATDLTKYRTRNPQIDPSIRHSRQLSQNTAWV